MPSRKMGVGSYRCDASLRPNRGDWSGGISHNGSFNNGADILLARNSTAERVLYGIMS